MNAEIVSKKDIAGNMVVVGDRVAVNPPLYKGIVLATVTKLTPSGVTVFCEGYTVRNRKKETLNRGSFVKV